MSRLHKPKAGFWVRLVVILAYPVGTIFFRVRWRHLDRIPSTGPVLIAMNHVSHADTVLMARLVWQAGRVPSFLVKESLTTAPVLGKIMSSAGNIPVRRGTSDAAVALEHAVKALDDGRCICIYPEGTITRDPDYWPMHAKTGIARLVLARPNVPVIPVAQWGAHRPKRVRWRPVVSGIVGEPMDLSKYAGAKPTVETLREITDLIMGQIRDEVAELRGLTAPSEFGRYPSRASEKKGD